MCRHAYGCKDVIDRVADRHEQEEMMAVNNACEAT